MLVTGRVEFEAHIVLLSTMWRAGVLIITLNGKSRVVLFIER